MGKRPTQTRMALPSGQETWLKAAQGNQLIEEEEEGFYMLRSVNKTDHMCQDIKVLTKH